MNFSFFFLADKCVCQIDLHDILTLSSCLKPQKIEGGQLHAGMNFFVTKTIIFMSCSKVAFALGLKRFTLVVIGSSNKQYRVKC